MSVFGCAWSSLPHAGSLQLQQAGAPLWLPAVGLLWLQSRGSRRAPKLSSCGHAGLVAQGVWHLPRPGAELMCPALAGGSFTTEPPGKAQ